MPGTPFQAVVAARGPDTVIEMRGDVNREAQSAVDAAYAEAALGAGRLLLDFSGTDYINSTGIALIVGVLARARAQGRKVGAYGLSPHYRELFAITRLSDFMTMYDDQTAAAAAAT